MIKIPISIGDIVRVGRFKNKRVKVKTIEYDTYGLPIINGRPLLTMRIEKLMEPKKESVIKLMDLLSEDIIENDSVLDTLSQALPHIKKLGNKPMLTRESGGIRSGAAKITSGPWDKGKIGSAINPTSPVYVPELGKLFKDLVGKFSMEHIIYASFQYKRGLFGSEYILIPVGDYKTIWSSEVHDIYSDASTMIKNGTIDSFPLDSYKTTWPVGKLSEVLVDCKEYYLVSTRIPIVQSSMNYTAMKQKTKIIQPTTYKELADIIERVIQYYIWKNKK
jgi:hypothetical protein